VSKERARRRAEREAEAARRAQIRDRKVAARLRRQARRKQVSGWLPRRTASRGQGGLLAAKRRRAAGLLGVGFLVVQFLTWVATPDWGLRVAVLLVSVLAVPLVAAFAL
jgi:hypothetical protein